jgi:hypothetical protein
MAQVSVWTKTRYGKETPYFIPPTFLYKQEKGISPHVCQIVALSQVAGYRFADWMSLWGFDLKMIFPLQLKIHTERTTIVTPRLGVPRSDVSPFFRNSRTPKSNGRYVFAKIGSRDAVAYPRLPPGSIVRVDPTCCLPSYDRASVDRRLWLVEHAAGLTCCYVMQVDTEHIVLLPNRPPLSAWPLRLEREARVLGLVDFELRPGEVTPLKPMCSPTKSELAAMAPCGGRMSLSRLLQVSRRRAGLTLRAAHEMTLRIAGLLGNRDCGIALGLLSDYEAMNKLPRHVAKIMSLCIVYGIDLGDLMEAGGINIDDLDEAPPHPWQGGGDLQRTA